MRLVRIENCVLHFYATKDIHTYTQVGFHHCAAQHGILSACLIFEMIVYSIAGIQDCDGFYLTQARTNDYGQND